MKPVLYIFIIFMVAVFSCRRNDQHNSNSEGNGHTPESVIHDTIFVPVPDTTQGAQTPPPCYSINSEHGMVLFRLCENAWHLDGINPDAPIDPIYSVTDADVLMNPAEKEKFVIVPRNNSSRLMITRRTESGTELILLKTFRVVAPPKPDLILMVNGQEYNGVTPINKRSEIVVKVKPDIDFQNNLPKDARYMISKIDVLVQRSLGAPVLATSESGAGKDATRGVSISLGDLLKSDPPGTKIYFKVDKVQRINFQGRSVEEKFGDRDLYLGAVLK